MSGQRTDLFRYSGMANPDITSGAKMIFDGLETPQKMSDDMRLKERQARMDEINTPGTAAWLTAKNAEQDMKIGGMSKEQEWKLANDPVYQNSLEVMKRETPGSPEWLKAQGAIQAMNLSTKREEWKMKNQYDPSVQLQFEALAEAKKNRIGQENTAKLLFNLPTENVTTTTVTPEEVAAIKAKAESDETVKAGQVFNDEYTRLKNPPKKPLNETMKIVGDVINGFKATPIEQAPISDEEAYLAALKKSGLDRVNNGESLVPDSALPKAGSKTTKIKYTPEEMTQLKLDALKLGVQNGTLPPTLALEVATKLTPVESAKDIREDTKVAIDVAEFDEKKKANYWNSHQKSPDAGSGKAIRSALEDMFKTYGSPDVIGTGDRANMEEKLSKIQLDGKYTDAQMTNMIEKNRSIYGDTWFGVNDSKFLRAVEDGLGKLPKK